MPFNILPATHQTVGSSSNRSEIDNTQLSSQLAGVVPIQAGQSRVSPRSDMNAAIRREGFGDAAFSERVLRDDARVLRFSTSELPERALQKVNYLLERRKYMHSKVSFLERHLHVIYHETGYTDVERANALQHSIVKCCEIDQFLPLIIQKVRTAQEDDAKPINANQMSFDTLTDWLSDDNAQEIEQKHNTSESALLMRSDVAKKINEHIDNIAWKPERFITMPGLEKDESYIPILQDLQRIIARFKPESYPVCIDSMGSNKKNLIMEAALENNKPVFSVLAKLSLHSPHSSLIYAIHDQQLDVVQALCTIDADCELEFDLNGQSLGCFTAVNSSVEVVRYLMQQGVDFESESPDEDVMPIHGAVMNGKIDIVRLLLESGVEANCCNQRQWTPLMYAVLAEKEDIIHLLMKYGADINAQDIDGTTALILAVKHNVQVTILKTLMSYEARVDSVDFNGCTALAFAIAEYKNIELISLLIEAVDINLPLVSDGSRALHLSAQYNLTDVIDLCMKNGAMVNSSRELDGMTPLALALCSQNKAAATALMNYGAHINVVYGDGVSIIYHCAQFGLLSMVELCIEFGARVNQCASDGESPFYTAIEYGHLEVAQLLASRGAHCFQPSHTGKTPFMIAQEKGNLEVISFVQSLIEQSSDRV